MAPPVLVQDQDHYSAVPNSYLNPTASAPIKVMIPALGDGWHFFWQKNSNGGIEAGVRGGIVPSEWESIKFWIHCSLTGGTIFEESTLAGILVGQKWSGHAVNITQYRRAGWAEISHLEIKRKPQSSEISLAALPRSGIGYIGERSSSTHRVESADPSADIHRFQVPNDAKFVFSPSNLVLWGNVESLSNTSSYFKTLFDSGFAESTPVKGKNQSAKSAKVERDFEDSDDEADDFILARDANQSSSTSPPQFDIPFRLVEISEAAYTTYHAVLCWIHTGNIVFAPVRSSFRLQPNSTAL